MTEWQDILKRLENDGGKLYEAYQGTSAQVRDDAIIIYFSDEETKKYANGLRQKLIKKLPELWKHKPIELKVGTPPAQETPEPAAQPTTAKSNRSHQSKTNALINPLQALDQTGSGDNTQPALEAAAKAEKTCSPIYKQLTEKTKQLAEETLEVNFLWRVRVGGMRGFQELLLPVLHPVYGVPYIPASSLKGAVRAWAKQNGESPTEINRLFGTLDNGVGCVQFFDAFPTKPCLSVDMANPQWPWVGNTVQYKPEPHALLSMEKPNILIGLAKTSRSQKDSNDVQTVKQWLEKALGAGIGSRVSAGYGRTKLSAGLPHYSSHSFQIWSQGMYGATPPAKENDYKGEVEFRPTAVRGILSYWFRAFALGLYSPQVCQQLENQVLGNLSQEGKVRIGVESQQKPSPNEICAYQGTILLEAKSADHLHLMEKLLCFASHVSGVGRGSRRPLHWNKPRMRGCHWELSYNILPCNQQQWKGLIQEIKETFQRIQQAGQPPQRQTPGNENNRYQDVLNNDAQIYLVPSAGMTHPQKIQNWQQQGNTPAVRGEALEVLYDNRFKGETKNKQIDRKEGNALVGGKLGIPSYVWIQSNFPENDPYQVVSVFGAGNPQRAEFIKALPKNSIQVYP